jgi:hypothetical protein
MDCAIAFYHTYITKGEERDTRWPDRTFFGGNDKKTKAKRANNEPRGPIKMSKRF